MEGLSRHQVGLDRLHVLSAAKHTRQLQASAAHVHGMHSWRMLMLMHKGFNPVLHVVPCSADPTVRTHLVPCAHNNKRPDPAHGALLCWPLPWHACRIQPFGSSLSGLCLAGTASGPAAV
jgi:hypothetical protein